MCTRYNLFRSTNSQIAVTNPLNCFPIFPLRIYRLTMSILLIQFSHNIKFKIQFHYAIFFSRIHYQSSQMPSGSLVLFSYMYLLSIYWLFRHLALNMLRFLLALPGLTVLIHKPYSS